MKARYWSFSIFGALALALDQLTKIWARTTLRPMYPHVKTVIAGYWELRCSENRGAAFGFLHNVPGAHFAFALAALVVAIGTLFYLRYADLRRPLRVAAELGFVVGGAIGNAIDRLALGHVTDFVVWKLGSHEWDTFNVADAALVVGIIGLMIDSGKSRAAGGKSAKAARAA
jgi:signal peptidase II